MSKYCSFALEDNDSSNYIIETTPDINYSCPQYIYAISHQFTNTWIYQVTFAISGCLFISLKYVNKQAETAMHSTLNCMKDKHQPNGMDSN
jgi:hypothetical protein